MHLYPQVKFFAQGRGMVRPRSLATVHIPAEVDEKAVEAITGRRFPFVRKHADAAVVLMESPADVGRVCSEHGVNVPKSDELYCLVMEKSWITAYLASRRAAYPALATLAQILQMESVPCGVIIDWPSVRVRSAHILKGMALRKERLFELFANFARFKLNQVVLEYEAKLRYDDIPEIALETAYTPDEIREIVAHAEMLGLEAVPLVQCVGHMAHVLSAERYAHLRESGTVNEWCTTNADSLALFRRIVAETLALHSPGGFCHMGGDECLRAPACAACVRAMGERNVTRPVYLAQFYNRCAAVVREYGKRPIIWSDIVESHPEMCEALDKDIVMMSWDYRPKSRVQSEFLFRCSESGRSFWQGVDIVNDLPEHVLREYRPFILTEGFPDRINCFAPVDYLAAKGFGVIGGSMATSHPYRPETDMIYGDNITNIRAWSEKAGAARNERFLGVCTTFWSVGHVGMSLPCFAAGGIGYWQGALDSGREYVDSIPWQSGTKQWMERNAAAREAIGLAKRRFYETVSGACARRNRALLGDRHVCVDLAEYVNAHIWDDFSKPAPFGGQSRFTTRPYLQYRGFPEGEQELQGIPFVLAGKDKPGERRRIALRTASMPQLPAEVRVAVGAQADTVWFLHNGSERYQVEGEEIGRYEVVYLDGRREVIPLVFGRTILDWYRPLPTPELMLAWDDGDYLGITLYAWKNPHRDKVIEAINVVSAGTAALISVFGITLGRGPGRDVVIAQDALSAAYRNLVAVSNDYLHSLGDDYRVHEGYLEGYGRMQLKKETMWFEALADAAHRGASLGTKGGGAVATRTR